MNENKQDHDCAAAESELYPDAESVDEDDKRWDTTVFAPIDYTDIGIERDD